MSTYLVEHGARRDTMYATCGRCGWSGGPRRSQRLAERDRSGHVCDDLRFPWDYANVADELSDPTMTLEDLETDEVETWARAKGLPWPPPPCIDTALVILTDHGVPAVDHYYT